MRRTSTLLGSGKDLPTVALLDPIAAALDYRLAIAFTATEEETVRPNHTAR